MLTFSQGFLITLGTLLLCGFAYFGILSLREQEKRAARVSFILAISSGSFFTFFVFIPAPIRIGLVFLIIFLVLVSIVLFLLPIGRIDPKQDIPQARFDERDVIFSRFFRIQPESPEFEEYYKRRPENKVSDEKTRAKPGLNTPGSLYYHPVLAAAVDASFTLTEGLENLVDGPVSQTTKLTSAEEITKFIKSLARYYGALHVGVTRLEPYHVYTHIGRGKGVYGEPIELEHSFAIAVSVEMDHEMIGPNPRLQGSMESAKQYVEAGRIAVQLAAFIRGIGYPARAHIDGNYRVICPLVARDAGLGEIGRMGLIMTPSHGPRVRLAVVTTDLPLITDTRTNGESVIDFCTICKKCAMNCPSASIPFANRQEIDGVFRWKIDSDTCFRYWMTSGTDCGRCMTVCPFSHPNNFGHNIIRWGVARSGFVRRAVNLMDDIFYSRKPERRAAPEWTRIVMKKSDLDTEEIIKG